MANKHSFSASEFHPRTQVLITGKPITEEQAESVIAFSKSMGVQGWCSPDGTLGHLDSIEPGTTMERLMKDLKGLAKVFGFLDMGITIMNGPPGTRTFPMESYRLKNKELKSDPNPHIGHTPPMRLKPKA